MYHFLQLITVIAHGLIQRLQPFLVPLCFIAAWAGIFLSAWHMWTVFRESLVNAQQMHKIPCSNCKFFTSNYYLKCPVHPTTALSEEAIDCPDFEKSGIYSSEGAAVGPLPYRPAEPANCFANRRCNSAVRSSLLR